VTCELPGLAKQNPTVVTALSISSHHVAAQDRAGDMRRSRVIIAADAVLQTIRRRGREGTQPQGK
jgi:hypothetical protein